MKITMASIHSFASSLLRKVLVLHDFLLHDVAHDAALAVTLPRAVDHREVEEARVEVIFIRRADEYLADARVHVLEEPVDGVMSTGLLEEWLGR